MVQRARWWGLTLATLLLTPGAAYYKPWGALKVSFLISVVLSSGRWVEEHARNDTVYRMGNLQYGRGQNHPGGPKQGLDVSSRRDNREERNRGNVQASSTEAPPSTGKRKLVGAKNFVRSNPKSDRFQVKG